MTARALTRRDVLIGGASAAAALSAPALAQYVRNYAPNLGNDVGGRLMAAWLDR